MFHAYSIPQSGQAPCYTAGNSASKTLMPGKFFSSILTKRARLLPLFILLGSAVVGTLFAFAPETAEHAIARLPESRVEMQKYVFTLVQERGIPFAVDVVAGAAGEKRISDDNCHLLLHVIGHEAYLDFGMNFDGALAPALQRPRLCSGGYVHGIEGQIAEEGIGAKDILWQFCSRTKALGVTFGPCFHGAGHTAFENLKDIKAALAFCDALAGGPEKDLSGCYRGAFSEMSLEMGGYDTHSGRVTPPLHVPGISNDNPLPYCGTLAKQYQYACYSQFSGLFFNGNTTMNIEPCLSATDSQLGRNACVEIVVALTARRLLPGSASTLAGYLDRVPAPYQSAALKGTWDAHLREQRNGRPPVIWESVCSNLASSDFRASCESFDGAASAALEAAYSK